MWMVSRTRGLCPLDASGIPLPRFGQPTMSPDFAGCPGAEGEGRNLLQLRTTVLEPLSLCHQTRWEFTSRTALAPRLLSV